MKKWKPAPSEAVAALEGFWWRQEIQKPKEVRLGELRPKKSLQRWVDSGLLTGPRYARLICLSKLTLTCKEHH